MFLALQAQILIANSDPPFEVSFWPCGRWRYERARELKHVMTNFETEYEVSGHSTGFIISAAIPEADKLAIGELEILVAWASALSFRAIEKGFQGWSVRYTTFHLYICLLIWFFR